MIYLDHAATSWPKPPSVMAAMAEALLCCGNPGRAGHAPAMAAADILFQARMAVAELFAIADPLQVCFTAGATAALNIAIKGMLRAGDHAVCSSMEHNAVWRPLKALERLGVRLSLAEADPDGVVRPEAVIAALRPNTKLIALTHASNVNGAVNDIAAVGAVARERGIVFLVDAAQTAGLLPIDVEAMGIDLMAFPGHKGLQGPPGVGGLYVRSGVELATLLEGGTGSESENPDMPAFFPDRLECGTLNLPGIAGLAAGIADLRAQGLAAVARRKQVLCEGLLDGLAGLRGVRLFGPRAEARVGVVSFLVEGREVEAASRILAHDHAIACRAGLHCAPLAHRTQGSERSGTIRFSLGTATTSTDIDGALAAVAALTAH